jgi:hypothetical protein
LPSIRLGSTLRLSLPFGKTLAVALVIVALLWGLAETVARTPWVRLHYPFTGVDSPNPYFDKEISVLDYRALALGQPVDCIVLGSSMVLNGFNPASFAAAYRQQTQTDLNCDNVGIPGMVAREAADIAQLLVDRYHPRLLILGTSARDFSDSVADLQSANGDVMQTPWVRYRLGLGFSLEGWLIDHSDAFHYMIGMRHWTQVWAQPPQAQAPKLPINLSLPPDRQTEAGTYDALAHYQVSPQDLAGLEQFLALPRQGVQVLVVEMPVHPTYLYFFGRGEQDQDLFRTTVGNAAKAHAVLFLPADPNLSLPNSDWDDRNHLSVQGGQVFSAWLAQQVAAAAGAGALRLTQR